MNNKAKNINKELNLSPLGRLRGANLLNQFNPLISAIQTVKNYELKIKIMKIAVMLNYTIIKNSKLRIQKEAKILKNETVEN